MKAISLSGSLRANVGKTDAKSLRREGKVPCVLYGGEQQIHFAAKDADFKPLLFTPEVHTINLSIDGNVYKAILQEVQFDPIKDSLLHADFLAINESKPIVIAIPVKVTGNSVGVRAGGKLAVKVRKMKVRGLLNDLPDNIEIDITNMEIGQSIKVRDIQNDKLQFLDAPNVAVVSVSATRASRSAESAEAAGKK
ncbi:MAG: 50S ribosomal protein L25/general stress protein Ctc [Flavobacteriales bacterium]